MALGHLAARGRSGVGGGMTMLRGLAVLLLCQSAGEALSRLLKLGFNLPLPGPVLGMLLLFAALVVRGDAPPTLRDTANGLLQHLSLLFVPAGAGVMTHAGLLASAWLPTSVAILSSTAVTLLVTAWAMRIGARGR